MYIHIYIYLYFHSFVDNITYYRYSVTVAFAPTYTSIRTYITILISLPFSRSLFLCRIYQGTLLTNRAPPFSNRVYIEW